MQLSIVVPVYNAASTLRRCVDSILSQTYTDFELILIDDGSTDTSGSICDTYRLTDKRVSVLHKQNEGLVAARKSGLAMAHGDYIGFVDSDDWIDGDMYETLMGKAAETAADMVVGAILLDYPNARKITHNLLPEGFYDADAVRTQVLPHVLVHSGFVRFGLIPGVVVKVIKKSILEKALPHVDNRIRMGEDVAITAYSVCAAQTLCIVDHAAYHYVQGEDSMLRTFSPTRFDNLRILYACLSDISDPEFQKQLDLYMAYLIFLTVAECVQKSDGEKTDKHRFVRDMLSDAMTVSVLRRAHSAGLSYKDRLKLFLMRHRMVSALMRVL